MRLLYHHRTQGKGAEGVHIREIIRALELRGHSVYIVSPPGIDLRKDDNLQSQKQRIARLKRLWRFISLHIPQVIFEFLEFVYNFYAVFVIFWKIIRFKINGIYERMSFFCWAGTFCAKVFHIPLIIEVNEISGIQRVRSQRFVSFAQQIELFVFTNASVVIAVSSFLKRKILERNVSKHKVFVLPNGINPQQFRKQPEDIFLKKRLFIDQKLVVGFVGVFVNWDNLEKLLEVFNNIRNKGGDIYMLLVGDGSNRVNLENRLLELNLSRYVVITGFVSREKVRDYISCMDICVLPSSNSFGSPIAMFEYMAMSKPVVVPNVEPVLDVVTDRVNSLVFENGNFQDLEKKICELIENPAMRREIGEAGSTLVLKKYTWEHNALCISALFEKK